MQITKARMQQIIQEELKMLSEQAPKYSPEDHYAARQIMLQQPKGLGQRRGQSRSTMRRRGGRDEEDFAHRGGGQWSDYSHLGMKALGRSNAPLTKNEQNFMAQVAALKKSDPEKYKALASKGIGRRVATDVDVDSEFSDVQKQGRQKSGEEYSSEDISDVGTQQSRWRFTDEPEVSRKDWKQIEGDWKGIRRSWDDTGIEREEEYTEMPSRAEGRKLVPAAEIKAEALPTSSGTEPPENLQEIIQEELQAVLAGQSTPITGPLSITLMPPNTSALQNSSETCKGRPCEEVHGSNWHNNPGIVSDQEWETSI